MDTTKHSMTTVSNKAKELILFYIQFLSYYLIKLELVSSGEWWVNAWWVTFHLQMGVVDSFHPQEYTHTLCNGCQEDAQSWIDEVAVSDSTDRYDSSGGNQISYFSLHPWISCTAANSFLCSCDRRPYRQHSFPCRWKSWVGDKQYDKQSVLWRSWCSDHVWTNYNGVEVIVQGGVIATPASPVMNREGGAG